MLRTAGNTPYQADFHAHKAGRVLNSPPLNVLQLKHETPPPSGQPNTAEAEGTTGNARRRIRCPKCQYEPRRTDLWVCSKGCGHTWNTFDTGGRCPACGVQWKDTVCPRCHQWSAHKDWYEDAPSGPDT